MTRSYHDIMENLNDNRISKYDRIRGGLQGVAHFTKPSTIKNVEDVTGRAETFIVETARHELRTAKQSGETGDTIFVECVDENGVTRLALPPSVSSAIARQRDALTARSRSRAAKTSALARKERGEVPGFMRKKGGRSCRSLKRTKVSARGWCYLLEQSRVINKNQFDKVESVINRCRRLGILPVDFVAEEDARAFSGVEKKSDGTVEDTLKWMLKDVLDGQRYYTPDWWDGEDYYIQMLVEKIDLKTLFEPVCEEYHIPIANSKGWSSILQRAEYSRRFAEAEERGLKCVLLYCGDHDPDGLRISDTLRANLEQVADVQWDDGATGYDPSELDIARFGLNYDFIARHGYTWIDNLITGSGKNLADPNHPNHRLAYVKNYLRKIGARKCEANAIVTTPDAARALCRAAIGSYLTPQARDRFAAKREKVKREYRRILSKTGLIQVIQKVLKGRRK